MKRPEWFWLGVLLGLAGVDVYCHRKSDGSTLSSVTRRSFRVHTKPGRLLFVTAWLLLSSWLLPHIILPAIQDLADDWTPEGP